MLLAALSSTLGWSLSAADQAATESIVPGTGGGVLVRVNGDPITETQVLQRLRAADPRFETHRNDPDLWSRLLESATEAEIRDRLLLQSARADGVEVSDDDVAAAIERSRTLLGKERYERMLAQRGADESQFAALLAKRLLIDRYRATITADIVIDETTLHSYYHGHTRSFRRPELVRLEIVELTDAAIAQQVAKRLRKGETLVSVSKIGAGIRTTQRWVDAHQLPPRLHEEVEAAVENDVLGPLDAGESTSVIRVGERKAPRRLTYEEAKPLIRDKLLNGRRQLAIDAWYEQAKQSAEIEYQ